VRIVAWKMGQKGRRTRDFMLKLEPDIALLQEATLPEEIPGYLVASTRAWEGKAWAPPSSLVTRTLKPPVSHEAALRVSEQKRAAKRKLEDSRGADRFF
jgi:hypothetical protein